MVERETITQGFVIYYFNQKQTTMSTITNKSTAFSGQPFYVGLDVHKKSWTITVRSLNLELRHFTQSPDVSRLARYLNQEFAGGEFFSAYEAGFCGTSIHTALCAAGIRNILIHPADLPQTDKQKNNKTDLHDSRAIARYLEKGMLSGIYIMPVEQQELRALFRCRQSRVKDVTRCTNRLRGLLHYFGVELPEPFRDQHHISHNFLAWVGNLELCTPEGTATLRCFTEELKHQRQQLLELTRKLKKAVLRHFQQSYTCLLSVPGIGAVTAIALLTETGDLSRFKRPDEFASWLGLTPSEHRSGDTVLRTGMQPRCNRILRPLLIEAAWAAVRRCPVMLAYYKKHAGKNNKKAIVKVARKLALTAKAVAVNGVAYQPGFKSMESGSPTATP
jgi:transposase